MMKQNKQKGFTLIELLAVIAIIGLLASIVLIALSSTRQSARDAKRIADVNQISQALEFYFNDNNAYPTTGALQTSLVPASGTKYLTRLPSMQPYQGSGAPAACDAAADTYESNYTSTGTSYTLNFCLEKGAGEYKNASNTNTNHAAWTLSNGVISQTLP